jgi:hypothetical protein
VDDPAARSFGIVRPSRGVLAGQACISPLPFIRWGETRLARLEREYGDPALARGHLFGEIGWADDDPATAERRWNRWRHDLPLVPLTEIEDALIASTSPLFSELYPDAAHELEATYA